MKKIVSTILATLFLISTFGITSIADDYSSYEGIWELYDAASYGYELSLSNELRINSTENGVFDFKITLYEFSAHASAPVNNNEVVANFTGQSEGEPVQRKIVVKLNGDRVAVSFDYNEDYEYIFYKKSELPTAADYSFYEGLWGTSEPYFDVLIQDTANGIFDFWIVYSQFEAHLTAYAENNIVSAQFAEESESTGMTYGTVEMKLMGDSISVGVYGDYFDATEKTLYKKIDYFTLKHPAPSNYGIKASNIQYLIDYEAKIKDYANVQNNNLYYGSFNNLDVNGIVNGSMSLVYALVDISDDGEPELIIASRVGVGIYGCDYNIYDMFGCNGGVTKRLLEVGSMGYRESCFILNNGYIFRHGSAGYNANSEQVLYLNKYSATPEYRLFEEEYDGICTIGHNDNYTFPINNVTAREIKNAIQNSLFTYKTDIVWYDINDLSGLSNFLNAAAKVTVTVNGKKLDFDQEPVISNNRTLVPLRKICDAIGAEIYYESIGNLKIISIIKNDTFITLVNGILWETNYAEGNWLIRKRTFSDSPYDLCSIVNRGGDNHYLDAEPVILNGRTLVPVRVITEYLGAEVNWISETKTVEIKIADTSSLRSAKEIEQINNFTAEKAGEIFENLTNYKGWGLYICPESYNKRGKVFVFSYSENQVVLIYHDGTVEYVDSDKINYLR